MSSSLSLTKYVNKYFGEFLSREDVTEVCYNGTDKIFALSSLNEWEIHDTKIDKLASMALVTAAGSEKKTELGRKNPILSMTLPNKERAQFLIDPATLDGRVSITIRKPSKFKISMDTYEKQKLFEFATKIEEKTDPLLELYLAKKIREFIELAVKLGKNIIVAGATGSGKTTFMKTLIDYIPREQRIISIEDVSELVFDNHLNHVQLFYPSEAKASDKLNATTLLKSCLRMKPDRIILAELRGGETFDFLNIINSGHDGSITSCHAGSVEETFTRLELMTLQNEHGQKIPHQVIKETLRSTIDVVIHMKDTKQGKRITEVYYKEAELLNEKGEK